VPVYVAAMVSPLDHPGATTICSRTTRRRPPGSCTLDGWRVVLRQLV
jgi:hypothetical protein